IHNLGGFLRPAVRARIERDEAELGSTVNPRPPRLLPPRRSQRRIFPSGLVEIELRLSMSNQYQVHSPHSAGIVSGSLASSACGTFIEPVTHCPGARRWLARMPNPQRMSKAIKSTPRAIATRCGLRLSVATPVTKVEAASASVTMPRSIEK